MADDLLQRNSSRIAQSIDLSANPKQNMPLIIYPSYIAAIFNALQPLYGAIKDFVCIVISVIIGQAA
jgi:hypothetical protein